MSRGLAGQGRPSNTGEPGDEAFGSLHLNRILTDNDRFKDLLARLPRYAQADLPVLILGEPGTGKELVAEALWALSPRQDQPFCRLNCANLGADLAGSELFGHLKGSFTGAERTRAGKFQTAHRGTLFLDEVGDLPLAVQPRLLRVIEHGEIEPVGGDDFLRVDVRVIAATNQNLPQLIAQGRFRQDVFDRLAVLVIELPSLRDRGEDVLFLARHFLSEEAPRYQPEVKDFSASATRRLKEHLWPGNVRELKNVITRAVLFSTGRVIQDTDLYFAPGPAASLSPWEHSGEGPAKRPSAEVLMDLVWEEGGNISAAARRLRVSTRTIYRWLKVYGVDLEEIRSGVASGPPYLPQSAEAWLAAPGEMRRSRP
jgi:DNA-binding NtrC family response regulator